jgi:hypothetical protein
MIRIAVIAATFLGTGAFALAAAFATVMATIMITRRRIASRKEADSATLEAASVAAEQTATSGAGGNATDPRQKAAEP